MSANNYIHINMKRTLQADRTRANRLRRINAVVPDALENMVYQYIAPLEIGTPTQHGEAAIDTGSSDLWVYSKSSGQPNSYDRDASSTFKYLNDDFSIQYVSGSAKGDWVEDVVTFGSDTVNPLQFATVDNQTMPGETSGVFGIGQVSQEAGNSSYLNFPAALKKQGKIHANAYSLYLDSIDANTGSSVTFGAVDTSKFEGKLSVVPFTSEISFNVDFEVLGFKSNGVLDSGTSLTYIDPKIADAIAEKYGATFSRTDGAYSIPSRNALKSTDPLVVTIGTAKISVPIDELFVHNQDGDPMMILTFLPATMSENIILLGDSFLRSAYVVYHLDANAVGIAQANWQPGPSNFVCIEGNTIPHSA